MLKKILFLGFTVSILIFSNNLFAEINSVVPLKKPILSKEEIQKKISINILKPLKKPTKTKEIKIEENLKDIKPGDQYQFERHGYFIADNLSVPQNIILNRTTTLRDNWQ